jgi:DNA-binding XRE family transcriptional regulator
MRSQANCRLLEKYWNKAVSDFDGAVYLVDLQERLVRGNAAFFDFVGRPPAQACGESIMRLIHGEREREPCPVCRARMQLRDAVFLKRSDDPMNRIGHPIAIIVRILRDEQGEPFAVLQGLKRLPQACAGTVAARMRPNEICEFDALHALDDSAAAQGVFDLSLADFFASVIEVFFTDRPGDAAVPGAHADPSAPPHTRLLLALKVRMLRLSRKWTQEELAFKAGLERRFIAAIELAEQHVSHECVEKLALAFGLTLDELLGPSEVLAAN